MLYRSFKDNTFVGLLLVPIIILLLWGNALLANGETAGHEVFMPFYEFLVSLIGNHPLTGKFLTLFIAFVIHFGVNRFNARFSLISGHTLIPGISFLIFVSGYSQVQNIQPIWIFLPFLLLALGILFYSSSKKEHSSTIFNASFLVSLGAVFYSKGLFFMPFMWWAMILLNIFSLRYWLASMLGMILPFIFLASGYYLGGSFDLLFSNFIETFISPVAFYEHNMFTNLYNALLLVILFGGVLIAIQRLNSIKIITRKYYRVIIMLVIYSIGLMITPFFSMELIPVVGIGAAFLITILFENVKKTNTREILFFLFLLITIVSGWLI